MHLFFSTIIFSFLAASEAFAASGKNETFASYPLVVCSLLAVILVLMLYDVSRRKNREIIFSSSRDLENQQRSLERLGKENEELARKISTMRHMLDALSYPVWRRDSELNIASCNRAYMVAIEGATIRDGKTPEIDRKMQAQAEQALRENKAVKERRYIIIGGARKLHDVTETPLPGGEGCVGCAIDVSDVDELKEDLARHNSAMDDFLESSASAMAIYGADMRLKSFNYAFVALWKLDEIWLNTKPTYGEILENLREKRKLPEQANFQFFKQQQQQLFRDLINPKEEFFYLPDGKALRVLAIPHALGGILFAYEDVTDRLALERSYNTLIAVQRETLDHLHEGVAVFGEDGRLKLSNPNYIKLWNIPEEFAKSEPHVRDIVEKCKSYYRYDEWENFKQNQIRQLQMRERMARQFEMANGKVIDWRRVPLPDGATLVTYMDITDSTLLERSLRERNDALQEADRLKSQFLANVSYELRSPLTSISGFSEMLNQEYFGPLSEKQREYVDGIQQSSQRLMHLINDILDLASIEAGYMRLEVAKFDISAMIKSVSSLIQERVREHGIKLKVECPARIGKMSGDETRIKQILFNLLSNAIKYSEKGDKISFGARASDNDEIIIWVQDQGQGIPKEEHELIFSSFYRGKTPEGEKGKTTKRSGTGLGLSIVRSFMELHGGRIDLISEPAKGTRFECIFLRDNPKLAIAA